MGSPPPMRGKVLSPCHTPCSKRITPAYAGKRQSWQAASFACGDHPRLCGEKRFAPASSSLVMGSPPPMRGKAEIPYFAACFTRITPAYAGKRLILPERQLGWQDHPRLCGEKPDLIFVGFHMSGSPPPMRGKGKFNVVGNHITRITPAYAGKSR